MEIRIISSEIIKPCSSTPEHLRSYKLSAMDQFSLHTSFPFVFFYSGECKNSDHLKKSLSQTLTYYYPFAGRLKNGFSVECDDYGVTFIEASVAGDMSKLIKQPKSELLEQLRPYNEEEMLNAQVNLAVQVNHFDRGGVAICVSFRHAIVDACAGAHFVRNWSKVANCGGPLIDIKDVIFDCNSIFPSQDVSGALLKRNRELVNDRNELVTKWFVFNNSKIAALQEKIGDRPTRFEALLALMWGAMIDANIKESNNNIPTPTTQFGALIPVNLRRKLDSALPEHCIGNVITIGMTGWPTKELRSDYKKIVFKVRELMGMVDEYVKNGFPNGWKNCIINEAAIDRNNTCAMKIFTFSSICRLPFYETDFGWGKPLWISLAQGGLNNTFVPIDTSDGKGIQVMVTLSEEDMAKFEQDPGILAYASSSN
ncbi:hypothetical protein Ddye_011403 [Dipteronia dyeriana]|uniref:Uncharacterized protein n=1 Tax=Dipteronia dyeriana TaxID=168575 RepID=A0AAD9X2G7_9ROSI|nr:hypothetical protein Ddye_011403 [Dipteronia dyeriana]